MDKSKVYYTNLRTKPGMSLLKKLRNLVKAAGIENINFEGQYTAIKLHFGEPGNMAYIRPNYVATVVDLLNSLGAKTFLTDANTLYKGRRDNAVDHLKSAMVNGFNPIQVNCNVIIADGLKGTNYAAIPVEGAKYCRAPKIGQAVADADIIISMSHFKGHEQAGFGGALKNLGMGCASIAGKLELHSSSQPKVNAKKCIGCKICEKNCNHSAITVGPDRLAVIDYEKCVGCGQCVALCQYEGAVLASWDTSEVLNYKIAEYTKAVLKDKPNFHISFIMNVSPECDCWGHNDIAIVPDLGMLASFDPVALDQACADLVNSAPAINGWLAKHPAASGDSGASGDAAGTGTAAVSAAASGTGTAAVSSSSSSSSSAAAGTADAAVSAASSSSYSSSSSSAAAAGTADAAVSAAASGTAAASAAAGNCCCHAHGHEESHGSAHEAASEAAPEDKFKIIHPDTDWEAGLRYAQELGLGNREYELVTV